MPMRAQWVAGLSCRRVVVLCGDAAARRTRRRSGVAVNPLRDGVRAQCGRQGPDRRGLRRRRQPLRDRRPRHLPLRPRRRARRRAHRVNSRAVCGHARSGWPSARDGALYAARLDRGARHGRRRRARPGHRPVVRRSSHGLPARRAWPSTRSAATSSSPRSSARRQVLRISGGRATPFRTEVFTDGITFGPDGTLYLAHQPDSPATPSARVARDGTRTGLARVPEADGMALGRAGAPQGGPGFLVVNRRDGRISSRPGERCPPGARPRDRRHARRLRRGRPRRLPVRDADDGDRQPGRRRRRLRLARRRQRRGSSRPASDRPARRGLRAVSGGSVKASSCRTNRKMKVRFRAPGGIGADGADLRQGPLQPDGERPGAAAQRHRQEAPGARFTLTIRAKTSKGRNIVVRRKYGACAGV